MVGSSFRWGRGNIVQVNRRLFGPRIRPASVAEVMWGSGVDDRSDKRSEKRWGVKYLKRRSGADLECSSTGHVTLWRPHGRFG